MTKQQHTPGPWKVSDTDPCSIWGKPEGNPPYTTTVAQTFGYMGTREANARLIAAAPDLLAALEALLTAANKYQDLRDKNGSAIFNAHAAIAKAKGE